VKTEGVEVEAERHRLLRVKREIYARIAAQMGRRQEMPWEERKKRNKRLNQECSLGKIRGSS
jgi:hypothetical protein